MTTTARLAADDREVIVKVSARELTKKVEVKEFRFWQVIIGGVFHFNRVSDKDV